MERRGFKWWKEQLGLAPRRSGLMWMMLKSCEGGNLIYCIYQLIDPQDHLIYYVGMTSGLDARFEQHLKCDGSNPAKDAWILGLREQGLEPIVQQLEAVTSKSKAQEREVSLIRSLINRVMPLLNRSGVVEE